MNVLEHRAEFEAILTNYRPSTEAMQLLGDMSLVLLGGPSGAGRNTIIEQLIKNNYKCNYKFIVSDTTRLPRINNGVKEKNGVNYWFRNENDFLEDLHQGNFLEAEIIHDQQVSGISVRELKKAHDSGLIALSEVEIGGFNNILSIKPDAVGIIVLPPTFEIWLKRLLNRNQMPEQEIRGRLRTSLKIFKFLIRESNKVHIVINDDLASSVQLVDKLANGGRMTKKKDTDELVRYFYNSTLDYLKTR